MLTKQASKHDTDFYGWTQEQAGILRETPPVDSRLDSANLAEEIEDVGRAEILAISSLLRQTLIHLLKSTIEPDSQAATHWFDEIVTFQGDAVLAFSPEIRQRLELEKIWRVACNGAIRSLAKRGVVAPQLPSTCPFSLDDLLDPEFDPETATQTLSAAIQSVTKHSI
ncbi:protein of unknown function DUF29 [Bradyrhizobium sp. Rc3b]|uniref:DUF29 domain-containing protein n=1 Tax=Bradyrhizobium sp. Rc3b TaxID=1855322 RepID=UPI0008F42906|nr:DUF29 domain-containing protein [Bradyrhizobium sp. Rc3b]SFN99694.1 protein of unknown function DUF29 [Bradyrhizobium sp. Rc3b]